VLLLGWVYLSFWESQMTAAMPWILLIVGLLVIGVGFFEGQRSGGRSVGRSIVLMGVTNVLVGATGLVVSYASQFSAPALIVCGVALAGLLATISRESWQRARVLATLGAATIIGIWTLYFLPTGPSPLRLPLLVLVSVLGLAFAIVTLVKGTRVASRL